jgi:hypothetical protein
MIIGGALLLLHRKTLASCFFVGFGLVQLIGLSVCGAKWLRYSLPLLPFLYLAAGYAVQAAWSWGRSRKLPFGVVGAAVIVLFWWPLLELFAWSPYYPLYLNTIGGGTRNITRYFSPDEVSEFDTRLVAQQVCPAASSGARLATARPNSMAYYLDSCGRSDIHVVPLYDPLYLPHNGDLIVLEPSRRFVETQRFFDLLERSDQPHRAIRVGPVATSTIYRFRGSDLAEGSDQEPGAQDTIVAASQDSHLSLTASAHKPVRAGALTGLPGKISDRQQP